MANRKIFNLIALMVIVAILALLIYAGSRLYTDGATKQQPTPSNIQQTASSNELLAIDELAKLPIKKSESGTDYQRSNFSSGWAKWKSCNVRQKILARDIKNATMASNGCTITGGQLHDPYTGHILDMKTKSEVAKKVQIDHVVALSNAWKTGARYLTAETRKQLANDDLNLIAVSSQANQEKSDGDASTWLPSNLAFRCAYVARQIAVKIRYSLWVTRPEYDAMTAVLSNCHNQPMPTE